MAWFQSKKAKEQERQKKVEGAVTKLQQPPQTVDKEYRPLKEKRTQYGYRGYDPKREPLVDYTTKAKGQAIKESLKVTPEDLTAKVQAAKKKAAKKK